MKHRFIMNLFILSSTLLFALSSCNTQSPPKETEASPTSVSSSSSTTRTESTTVSSTPTDVLPATSSEPRGYGVLHDVETEYGIFRLRANQGNDSQLWTLYEMIALPIAEEFIIPSYLEGVGAVPYVMANNIYAAHIRKLTFDEGIEAIDFSVTDRPIGYVQEVALPSTLYTLIGYSFEGYSEPYGYPFQEGHYLRFTSQLLTNHTFPSAYFPELQRITVAEGNPLFEDEDGILYRGNHLVCIPQDYQSTDGTVIIREGTVDLYMGAVTECRNITRLVIPDSVLDLNVRAIIATAEHPLTVVCSRGSAAATYVEEFGEQYHLTVEYTD